MSITKHNVKIQNETFGVLVDETFVNSTQFTLFLKMIQGCISLQNDLTFFNGTDFLIHIPYMYLKDSIIVTKVESDYTLKDHLVNKSKIEALETKD